MRRLSYIIAFGLGCLMIELSAVVSLEEVMGQNQKPSWSGWDLLTSRKLFLEVVKSERSQHMTQTVDYVSFLREQCSVLDREPVEQPSRSLLATTNDAEFLAGFEEYRLRIRDYFEIREQEFHLLTACFSALPFFVVLCPVVMVTWARLAWPGRNVFSRRLGRRRGDGG